MVGMHACVYVERVTDKGGFREKGQAKTKRDQKERKKQHTGSIDAFLRKAIGSFFFVCRTLARLLAPSALLSAYDVLYAAAAAAVRVGLSPPAKKNPPGGGAWNDPMLLPSLLSHYLNSCFPPSLSLSLPLPVTTVFTLHPTLSLRETPIYGCTHTTHMPPPCRCWCWCWCCWCCARATNTHGLLIHSLPTTTTTLASQIA